MILSAHAESIILSAGGTKQQSTKSCSRKCGDDGGGRGNSGGGNEFDVGSGDDNCSDDSNGDGNGDPDSGDGDSSNDDSNSDSGSGNSNSNSNSGGKNNNQQVATVIDAGLASILWWRCWGERRAAGMLQCWGVAAGCWWR
jgi:hypothetical protein